MNESRLFRVPDAEFVGLLRERDEAAWRELRQFLGRLARNKAWGAIDESHSPDDYVQLACLRLWKVISRPRYADEAPHLKAYLAVTMRNLIVEAHRRRGGMTGSTSTRGARVGLDEANRIFDRDRGVPRFAQLQAEYEQKAKEAFEALGTLSRARRGYLREIAGAILDRVRPEDPSSLLMALDSNLFRLVHGETSDWSEKKKNKHRVRLNRFREAFLKELARLRRQKEK